MRYDYRVNFGNGTVHYAGSLFECLRFIYSHGDAATFLEQRDPDTGDWHRKEHRF